MHMFLKTILPKINKIRLCSAPKLPHFWDTVYITDCVLTFEWQQCACCDCIRVLFAHFITQLDARIVWPQLCYWFWCHSEGTYMQWLQLSCFLSHS